MIGLKQVNIIVAQFLGIVAFEHEDHPGGTLVGHFKGLLRYFGSQSHWLEQRRPSPQYIKAWVLSLLAAFGSSAWLGETTRQEVPTARCWQVRESAACTGFAAAVR